MPLWLQHGTSANATGLLERRGYHRLLSPLLGPTRWETWGPSKQINTVVNVLDLLAIGLVSHVVPWQTGLPAGWVLTCYLGILSRQAFPPLSALTWQHAGTSCEG